MSKHAKEFFESIGEMVVDEIQDGEVKDQSGKVEVEYEEKEDKDSEDVDGDYAFVVATSKRGSRSILHLKGGCWRAQRLAFNNYELVKSTSRPLASFYDGYCRDCWKGDAGPWTNIQEREEEEEVVSGEAGSSTSSDSSAS